MLRARARPRNAISASLSLKRLLERSPLIKSEPLERAVAERKKSRKQIESQLQTLLLVAIGEIGKID